MAGVLAPFLPPLITWHNAVADTSHTLSDFKSYRFADTWGGSDAAATAVVEAWFATGALSRLPPLPGAAAGLAALRDRGARLVVVTSRQAAVAAQTADWLVATYPGVFEGLGCGNAWGQTGRRVSKRELCAAAGAALLVDDNPAYCAEVGCDAVCFDLGGAYGWSKGGGWKGARAESWEEVVAVADKLVWGRGGGGADPRGATPPIVGEEGTCTYMP
ncbi:hypothetical protein MMPV_005000 [Pyropia vietnamensis]